MSINVRFELAVRRGQRPRNKVLVRVSAGTLRYDERVIPIELVLPDTFFSRTSRRIVITVPDEPVEANLLPPA